MKVEGSAAAKAGANRIQPRTEMKNETNGEGQKDAF